MFSSSEACHYSRWKFSPYFGLCIIGWLLLPTEMAMTLIPVAVISNS
ncbi:MAG: hypothetical protein M3Z01_08505 [Thermoproteota archaeon]|nr:hypothetical protein [Thermoproteota archaeon]